MTAQKSTKKKGVFRFIKVIFIFLNVLCVLALGAAYLSPYISPASNSYLPFFGLAYPVLILVNLLFVIIWLFFNWHWSLLSFLSICAGYSHIFSHIQYSKEHSFGKNEYPVKVLSYNVKNFDLYNYSKDWKTNQQKRNLIFELIQKEQPGIICYQEFVNDLSGVFKTLDSLVKIQEAANVHAEYTVVSRNTIQFGIATFSKYPIVAKGRIDFDNSTTNICIYTDILLGKDTVRIYNAHFESIHFSKKDYEYASDFAGQSDMDKQKKSSRRILSLLRAAFSDRASQAEKVAEHISKCTYPVILCTDLNDTPCSYSYHQLSKTLDDAFIESGSGIGNTYAGIFPSFRIDYIFHSHDFNAYNYRTIKVEYSDHFPISCEIVKE